MEPDRLLVLVGLVAPPLFAALTLWYSGVAVSHVKVAEKCGGWLAMAGLFGVMSIVFIMTTICAIYVGRVNYGWLIAQTSRGPTGYIWLLLIVDLLMWLAAFASGERLIKRRRTKAKDAVQADEPGAQLVQQEPDSQPPVREYGPPVTEGK